MSDKNFFLYDLQLKFEPIQIEGAKEARDRLNAELKKLREMIKPEHTRGALVVDSDAIVIDEAKALPGPKEQQNQ